MNDCIFCKILANEIQASMVYRDETCAAFMDIQPINPGHILVIPVAHAAGLGQLDPEDGRHLFEVAQKIANALRNSDVRCEGVNLFLADGEAAGQDVFHAHLHVFPRYAGDGFGFRRGPMSAVKPARAELDGLAQQVRVALGSRS